MEKHLKQGTHTRGHPIVLWHVHAVRLLIYGSRCRAVVVCSGSLWESSKLCVSYFLSCLLHSINML